MPASWNHFTKLLKFLTQHFTTTSGSLQLCSTIIYNILIVPKLSNRALNVLVVLAETTQLGKLFYLLQSEIITKLNFNLVLSFPVSVTTCLMICFIQMIYTIQFLIRYIINVSHKFTNKTNQNMLKIFGQN